ncbi:acyl-CoA N-acyltransferase [Hymenopellis radicata]|nr:acyl-CoA N-acyltransferase [Hymenopellis radicata]
MFKIERLLLRAFKESDMDNIMELMNDERVQPFISTDYIAPLGPAYAQLFKKNLLENEKVITFILETLDTHEFVGQMNLAVVNRKNRDAEFSIMTSPRWWNIGFGSEATAWCVDYAFRELDQHRLSLSVFGGNPRAIDLYRRMGFKQEGVKRTANWNHGKWEDIVFMAILDEEWQARQKEEKDAGEWVTLQTPEIEVEESQMWREVEGCTRTPNSMSI